MNLDYVWFEKYTKDQEYNRKIVESITVNFFAKKAAFEIGNTTYAKTGTVDRHRLQYHKTSDNIFKMKKQLPKGKNHGVFILLDVSASMKPIFRSCIQHVINLCRFCIHAQIPFELFSFTGISNKTEIIHLLSSRLSRSGIEAYLQRLWLMAIYPRMFGVKMESTPTIQAIANIGYYVSGFKRIHNLDVVNFALITDGEHDGLAGISTQSKFIVTNHLTHQKMSVKISNRNDDLYTLVLSQLKNTVNLNSMWFYIGARVDIERVKRETLQKDYGKTLVFEDDGFIEIKNSAGFDVAFLVDRTKMFGDDDIVIDGDSISKINKSFSKKMNNNRIKKLFGMKIADSIAKNL